MSYGQETASTQPSCIASRRTRSPTFDASTPLSKPPADVTYRVLTSSVRAYSHRYQVTRRTFHDCLHPTYESLRTRHKTDG